MTPEQLLEDYGLFTPELAEQRAHEAEELWRRHLLADYEAWLDEQCETELESESVRREGCLILSTLPRGTSTDPA
jgi:hypothetical protein